MRRPTNALVSAFSISNIQSIYARPHKLDPSVRSLLICGSVSAHNVCSRNNAGVEMQMEKKQTSGIITGAATPPCLLPDEMLFLPNERV